MILNTTDVIQRNILSIDGGGIKGVFAAKFLADLEEKCGTPLYNHFDMIAGTSTGAIIAAALSIGIPAKEILNFYTQKGPQIFKGYSKSHIGRGLNTLLHLANSKYSSKPLKAALEECFQDKLISDCKTRLVIPAYNLRQYHPTVFKTPHLDEYHLDYKEKIVDILLATTAAPTYFDAHKIGDRGTFIDGGVFANNPTSIATIEGISKCKWDSENIYVLSIGSVIDSPQKLHSNLRLKDGLKIVELLFDAERQQNEYIPKILLGDPQRYYRINTPLPPKVCCLDNATPKAIDTLIEFASEQSQNNLQNIFNTFCSNPHNDYNPCYT